MAEKTLSAAQTRALYWMSTDSVNDRTEWVLTGAIQPTLSVLIKRGMIEGRVNPKAEHVLEYRLTDKGWVFARSRWHIQKPESWKHEHSFDIPAPAPTTEPAFELD